MPVRVFDESQDVVENLFAANAVGFKKGEGIRFKSGILSPGAYLNNRVLPSHPIQWHSVTQAMIAALPDFDTFDVVAAVATGGIAHASVMVTEMACYKPMVIVKKAEKEGYGLAGLIDGDPKIIEGKRVLMIEDMSSTFGSTLKAMKPIEACGGIVVHTIAISTWGFPIFHENVGNHEVTVLCSGKDLINYAASTRLITPDYAALLHSWQQNPEEESWVSDEWNIPSPMK